jgi:hypothetical protein
MPESSGDICDGVQHKMDPVLASPPIESAEWKTRAASAVCLKFSGEIPGHIQSRIAYAFRVFAAIYGYRVVETDEGADAICFEYGKKATFEQNPRRFHVPARYRSRPPEVRVEKFTKHRYANEDLYLVYGIDEATGKPDWLGEIFEWISSSHELSVSGRDDVGRINYSDMIFSRLGISPRKPYATLLMAWMENSVRHGKTLEALPKARSPIEGVEHVVVCSHDIDFYHVNRISALVRLFKNLGIACRVYKSWSFFASNSKMIVEVLGGKRVGEYLPAMLEAIEKCGFHSTLFIVPRQAHRRDPNYRAEQLRPDLLEANKRGFSVALHGSYTSLIGGAALTSESQALEEVTGKKPLGNRQHWLRFDRHEKLFEAIESAGLVFDSTLGFSETAGFRNGASFAFPPYDFKNEKPHRFLEIPLVLMDTSLEAASRALRREPQELADEVLQESRKWSWGGISLIWHNPMEPLQVPEQINEVFWNCARKRRDAGEQWMSGRQFLSQCLSRYQDAGLMEGVRVDF